MMNAMVIHAHVSRVIDNVVNREQTHWVTCSSCILQQIEDQQEKRCDLQQTRITNTQTRVVTT